MRGVFARDYTQRPITVVARECMVDGIQIGVGDLVTVRVLDQDVTFGIRVCGPGEGAGSWRGTIFHIERGEESVTYAEGLEVHDTVEVSRAEIAEIIKCNDTRGSAISAAQAAPATGAASDSVGSGLSKLG